MTRVFTIALLLLCAAGSLYSQNTFIGTWKITATLGLLSTGDEEKEKVYKQYWNKKVRINADEISVAAKGDYLKSFKGLTINFTRYVSYKKAPGIFSPKFFAYVYDNDVFGIDEYETNYKIANSEPPNMMLYKINEHHIVLQVNNFLFFLERK